MGRIRTVKPEFWQDEDLALLDAETRLLALGLLNHADDEGFFKAHPSLVRAAVFPFSEHSMNIHDMLKQLEKVDYLGLFKGSDGKPYGVIKNFSKHQKVNRPSPSKIKPFQTFNEDSLNDHGELSSGTGNREQGTGNMNEEKVAEVSAPSEYAFEGEHFRVNQKDFSKHRELYPNLNLLSQYQQLDQELRDTPKKQRWSALNAKLNYRNEKLNSGSQQSRGESVSNVQRQLNDIQAEREQVQAELC